jgi:hypothetical protein
MAGFNLSKVKDAGPYHYLVMSKPGEYCGL